jgi:hypothetical protein
MSRRGSVSFAVTFALCPLPHVLYKMSTSSLVKKLETIHILPNSPGGDRRVGVRWKRSVAICPLVLSLHRFSSACPSSLKTLSVSFHHSRTSSTLHPVTSSPWFEICLLRGLNHLPWATSPKSFHHFAFLYRVAKNPGFLPNLRLDSCQNEFVQSVGREALLCFSTSFECFTPSL